MKTKLNILFALVTLALTSSLTAQTTAMNFSGVDCNGNNVDLFSDLEAGKAVVLFFYMPNCSACPPHAKKIQKMGETINATYPGMFKAYAFPYQNSTTCTYSNSWVTNNNIPLFAPMDSGAVQVANYGGFAMPTTVLLGGLNKDILFAANANNSNDPGDTTTIKNAILALFAQNQLAVKETNLFDIQTYPNPATDVLTLSFEATSETPFTFELCTMDGKMVYTETNKYSGLIKKEIKLATFEKGNYLLKVSSENQGTFTKQISIQ